MRAIIAEPPRESKPAMPHTQQMHVSYPRFRIATLLWLSALMATSMATFGAWGLAVCGGVLLFWWMVFWGPRPSLVEWFVLAIVLVALLLPAVQSSRSTPNISSSANRLKQLVLAALNYEDEHGHWSAPYTMRTNGQRLHSWRTLLLPFYEEEPLYRLVSLDEAWDSANNWGEALLAFSHIDALQSPRYVGDQLYANPVLEHETHYLAVVDSEAVFTPDDLVRTVDIHDGAANTIVMIEVFGRGIRWYEPRDLSMVEAIDLLSGDGQARDQWTVPGYFATTKYRGYGYYPRLVGFADGHVERVYPLQDRALARALLTRAGGEDLSGWRELESQSDRRWEEACYTIHWGRVWGAGTFCVVVLMPAWGKLGRGRRGEA